jgi:TfoX/Sxy family transcriptional regulator of competence genes
LAIDEKAVVRLRRVLARRRNITEKKMMGALCFMAGDTMCSGITGNALMVRVGPENYEKALARPHVRPLKIGKRAARGFVLIDPLAYRTEASLRKWVEQGLAVAKTLGGQPAKRPAAKQRRPVK